MSDRLAGTKTRMTHIMMSRGCPFSCHFCAVSQKRIQYRSGINVKAELEQLKSRYNIDGFAIVDDNFVVNKNKVIDICENIKDLSLKWSALSRVDTVDYELLEVMHDAGCIEIKFGVESGSDRMLSLMGKNVSCNQIKQAVTLAHSAGINVKAFLVHGFPGENFETTKETISLLKEISSIISRVTLFRFVPLPGSFVFRNAGMFNLHLVDDWNKYHIYHNNFHWWGNKDDFLEVERSYQYLKSFIDNLWPK